MAGYSHKMMDSGMNQKSHETTEAMLRERLYSADTVTGASGPVLRHLLANDDHSLFSEEIVARVRGMTKDIARQWLAALNSTAGFEGSIEQLDRQCVIETLHNNYTILRHLHCLALEYQLAEGLQRDSAIDPVLSPLVQSLIASSDSEKAELAMSGLAAQTRFLQQQRRMEIPLGELPGDVFHALMRVMRTVEWSVPEEAAKAAEQQLRDGFEEGQSRLGLLSRLVTDLGGGNSAALSVTNAGLAIFLTALSQASGQDRCMTVLSTNDRRLSRLALSLRAASLKAADIEKQLDFFHPDVVLSEGFELLRPDGAAALLAEADSRELVD